MLRTLRVSIVKLNAFSALLRDTRRSVKLNRFYSSFNGNGSNQKRNTGVLHKMTGKQFLAGMALGLGAGFFWTWYDKRVAQGLRIFSDDDQWLQPPTNCPPFPWQIELNGTTYEALGVGVRAVTFMQFHIYALGIYIASEDKVRARQLLGRYSDLPIKLFDENQNPEIIDLLLSNGIGFDLRIMPVRNTDFGHLRDGFIRTIMASFLTRKIGQTESFAEGLGEFKRAFSRKRDVSKGDTINFSRQKSGILNIYISKQASPNIIESLGTVKSPDVSRCFFLQYMSGKKPCSPSALESFLHGLLNIAK